LLAGFGILALLGIAGLRFAFSLPDISDRADSSARGGSFEPVRGG
jgi:hypothetical protein